MSDLTGEKRTLLRVWWSVILVSGVSNGFFAIAYLAEGQLLRAVIYVVLSVVSTLIASGRLFGSMDAS